MVEAIRWLGVLLGGFVIGLSFSTGCYYAWRYHIAANGDSDQVGPLSPQRLRGILCIRLSLLSGSVLIAIVLLHRIADNAPFTGFSFGVIATELAALYGLVSVHVDDQRQLDEARNADHPLRRKTDLNLH